jgi:hypothetical protein
VLIMLVLGVLPAVLVASLSGLTIVRPFFF